MGGAGGAGGAHLSHFVACLRQLTIDHASLSRRSTDPTPNRDTSNISAEGGVYSLACMTVSFRPWDPRLPIKTRRTGEARKSVQSKRLSALPCVGSGRLLSSSVFWHVIIKSLDLCIH